MMAEFFIDRPIFAWVLSLVIILIGAVSAIFLPVDQYPPITPPTVQVTASYPGASAQVVADTIAAPIEQQVNGVENMLYMSSQSNNDGTYTLTVTFEIGTDLNIAQVLVQNRVALAQPQLPAQVQLQGLTIKKRSPNILLVVNLVSPEGRFSDIYMSNYATIRIRDELLRIKGVGDINIVGQRDYAMRIWLDPDKLAAKGLTAVDVANAIRAQNVQVAAGQIGQEPAPPGQQFQLPMTALGRLDTPEQFGDIILKTGRGTPQQGNITSPEVRVRDVARIEMGAQSYDVIARLDGRPSAGLAVFQLPGSNALAVADAVKQRMEELKAGFPAGLEYRINYDTTPFIRQSVEEVFKTLWIAVLLVAAVVLFFLQDWRAMILPMIDVPVSLIGTFAVMALLGFSLNNLTLFGLVLAIGIVVDDAIVVLENIERHIARGLHAREATITAMGEITGPIVAITLVLASVFLPSLLVPGLTGQFYRQFAVTISVSMVISAVNAMTLTPSRAVAIFRTEERLGGGHEYVREALPWWIFAVVGGVLSVWFAPDYFADRWGLPMPEAGPGESGGLRYWTLVVAWFLPGAILGGVIGWFVIRPVNAALGWLFRGFNWVFDWITAAYGWMVGRALRLSLIVLAVYAGLLWLTYRELRSAPTGFIPVQDQGYLLANVQLPDSISVQRTQAVMARIDKIARSLPGVAHTLGISGTSFLLTTNGSNLGSMFVVLKPWADRTAPEEYDEAVAAALNRRCAQEIKDAVVAVFRAPPVRGLANAGGFQLQVEQRGFVDYNRLQAATGELVRRANADPHFAGVFSLFRAGTPQLYIDIDRAKVEALQVPIQDVFTTLQVFMGGLYVNQFNAFGRTWQVQVQAEPRFRTSADQIGRLRVRNVQGQTVPVGTLARVEDIAGPLFAQRYDLYASAPVNGTFAPGVSSGEGIDAINAIAEQAGVSFEWTQLTFLQVQAGNVAYLIFALGTLLVYFVLAAKYESWGLPLAVILVVPMCLLSSVVGMLIAGLPVDIFVQIGFLVLVGMAAKNAILIVEYARQLQEEGREVHAATVEASRLRLRPIVMTSLAFIFGVLPLVFSTGAGAEMRQSLGTAVFGGTIGVTVFGLLLTPVFFFAIRRRSRSGGRTEPIPPP